MASCEQASAFTVGQEIQKQVSREREQKQDALYTVYEIKTFNSISRATLNIKIHHKKDTHHAMSISQVGRINYF